MGRPTAVLAGVAWDGERYQAVTSYFVDVILMRGFDQVYEKLRIYKTLVSPKTVASRNGNRPELGAHPIRPLATRNTTAHRFFRRHSGCQRYALTGGEPVRIPLGVGE